MGKIATVTGEESLLPHRNGAKRRDLWSVIRSHCRRLPLEFVNFFVNHDPVFRLIGTLNKRVGLIESVFLAYPADDEYGLAFTYPHRLKKNRWVPWPIGLLWQNGKLTVMFAIAATNEHYADPANTENLRRVCERMEVVRKLLCANRKTFAGILPGVFYLKRIMGEAPEADLTAAAVSRAIDLVKIKESLDADTPIVVLGGRGFIGRRIVKLLDKGTAYSIDLADGQSKDNWPTHLLGRIIVVNVTLGNALDDYVDAMPPGTVVINEAYPPPTLATLERLSEKDCSCYHVAGVKAMAFPSFPGAYSGAIPCCAAWPSPKMEVAIRKLV